MASQQTRNTVSITKMRQIRNSWPGSRDWRSSRRASRSYRYQDAADLATSDVAKGKFTFMSPATVFTVPQTDEGILKICNAQGTPFYRVDISDF